MGITVIKARDKGKRIMRVAAYCRVSSDTDEQESSIDNQIAHYEELIRNNPNYENAGIYFDQGISGFKEDRPGFQKMMEEARKGKIDLIITKSITRFARNTDTVLKATRELKGLGIGVFFELQNINTLTQAGELMMTVYAAFAQGESQTYRDLAIIDRRRRFEEGKPMYKMQETFGYRPGVKKGEFEIVPEEALIIKQIYKWVRDEYTVATILKMAKAAGYKTRRERDFTASQIYGIVRNVIYKGDYIMQRTFIDDNRKMHFNKGQLTSWYIENDHPAIVTKKLWKSANGILDYRAEERLRHIPLLPMTEENYPYKKKLFCGYCGQQLYYSKTRSNAQYTFFCGKKNRSAGECCKGISVPQKVIESWGNITENIYISFDPDKPIPKQYSFVKEVTWQRKHEKKNYTGKMKSYSIENYHYYKRVFCEECGWPLYRIRRADGKICFTCAGRHNFRLEFCNGINVPEEVMDKLPKQDGYYVLKEEIVNGEKCYSYSCRSSKPERKKMPAGKT